MSLYSYHVFLTVVEQKSFAKAAQILQLTPSAVSHTIADLEKTFGFPLFLRGRKNTLLTDDGRQALVYIQDILATQHMLDQWTLQIRNTSIGAVHLGVIDSVAVSWLPQILETFHTGHPDITLYVHESSYQKLIDDVIAQRLDMAIVSHSSLQETKYPLQYIPLYNDRIVCVSRKPLQESETGFLSAKALNNQPLILPREGNEIDILTYLQAQDITIHCKHTAVTNTSLITMVRCGLGHAITPALSLAVCDCTELHIASLVPLGFRNLGIITKGAKFFSPAVAALVEIIRTTAEKSEQNTTIS